MKLMLSLVLLVITVGDLDRIATINKMKKEAREAYNNGNYDLAIHDYEFLLDSMKVTDFDDGFLLNMANSYYQAKDTAQALEYYNKVAGGDDKVVSSVAHQQLGIMANRDKKFEQALDHFKNALKDNPANEDARYNYELLKKVLDEQKKNQNDQQKDKDKDKQDQKKEQDKKSEQNKDQQNQNKEKDKDGKEQKDQKSKEKQQKDEESKEKGDQQKDNPKDSEKDQKKAEQEKKGTPDEKESDKQKNDKLDDSVAKKLEDMKITEEKARMILDAMKNNEIQYIQQNKRKATKRKDSSKPDW